MKKVYINPETECLQLDAEALMQIGVNGSEGDRDQLSKEFEGFPEDDSEQ